MQTAITDFSSLGDALKNLAAVATQALLDVLILQPIANFASNLFSSVFGNVLGGIGGRIGGGGAIGVSGDVPLPGVEGTFGIPQPVQGRGIPDGMNRGVVVNNNFEAGVTPDQLGLSLQLFEQDFEQKLHTQLNSYGSPLRRLVNQA